MGYLPASVKQLQKSLTACFPQRSDFLISTCRDPGCAATEGRGTQTSPPILSVNEFWIQLWLSFAAGTHTKTPDAFLKVAALFKKLSRTGSPSQTTLRFLFLGGFRVLVCQEREMTVLPCASPSTSSCRRALGSLVGQLPVDSTSRGNTHTLYSPMLIFPPLPPKKERKRKKKEKDKKPSANLSFSLQGFAFTFAPRLEPRPTAGPTSQPCFKRHLLKIHCLHTHHRLPATILTIFY